MKDVCRKCSHKKSCRSLCRPVELYLGENNLSVFEKNVFRKRENIISEIEGNSVSLNSIKSLRGERSKISFEAFSTENENPFRHYEANYKQTSVFIKRFFGKWSYPDIAKAHDISTDAREKIILCWSPEVTCCYFRNGCC